MHLTNEEKETIILFNEADEFATCDTCNRKLINKLDRFTQKSNEIQLVRQDEYGKTYKFPKKWVRVNMSIKLSEEEKQKRSERGKRNTFGRTSAASDENS